MKSDITPLISERSQIIQSYGNHSFRVCQNKYDGSILVTPHQTYVWPITQTESITFESLSPLFNSSTPETNDTCLPMILFLGCGPSIVPISNQLRHDLRSHGVIVELMDTGAACRTYNITMAEGRSVCAALIAVP